MAKPPAESQTKDDDAENPIDFSRSFSEAEKKDIRKIAKKINEFSADWRLANIELLLTYILYQFKKKKRRSNSPEYIA